MAPPIQLFNTTSIYGKRRSGKSVFVKWYLQFFKHEIPWYWVFTLTQLNSFYAGFIPDKFVIPDFNAAAMDMVMERQTRARKLAERNPDFNPRACVIWDDYNGADVTYNRALANYYYTGRHYFTMNIFCAQHITLTPPAIRSNTDLAVLFNTDYADSIEHYNRDWAGKLDKHQFATLFAMATCQKNHFLAIDNDPTIPIEDKFYTGKAEMLDEGPDWILGCKEAWRDNQKQLYAIQTGVYAHLAALAHKLSEHKPSKLTKTNPLMLNSVEGKECDVSDRGGGDEDRDTVEAGEERAFNTGLQRNVNEAMGRVGGGRREYRNNPNNVGTRHLPRIAPIGGGKR